VTSGGAINPWFRGSQIAPQAWSHEVLLDRHRRVAEPHASERFFRLSNFGLALREPTGGTTSNPHKGDFCIHKDLRRPTVMV
jgi:hypothetical protein